MTVAISGEKKRARSQTSQRQTKLGPLTSPSGIKGVNEVLPQERGNTQRMPGVVVRGFLLLSWATLLELQVEAEA